MKKNKRILMWTILAILAILLVLVALIALPMLTHKNVGSSGQESPQGFENPVTATGADGRTRTLIALDENGQAADLSSVRPGDRLTITGTGYDSDIGIYVGFCKVPDEVDERPTPCLAGIPDEVDDALESAWITNNWAWRAFASHTFEDETTGSFKVELVVPEAEAEAEGLDCRVQSCGIFTRADHTALSERVQDIYLPIAFE